MILTLNKRWLGLSMVVLLFPVFLQAQEMLVDLNGNHALSGYDNYVRSERFLSARAAGDTLSLPFFDDFSEPFSRLRTAADLYPNPDRWIGNTVYINNHMAINPISQGVATFDGLDERGRAYGFGFSLPTLSDSLTSKPIDLSSAADTVYLSFYYQAQGMGNAPEGEDILVLEFKDTSDTWERVWEAEGYILQDFDFRRGMVPVIGEQYLYNGFQFRFMNYASRAGSVDHWHLDYVKLDGGRTAADTIVRDVSMLSQTSYLPELDINRAASFSLLKEFSSMPWKHYLVDSTGFIGDTAFIALRNNDTTEISATFSFQLLDHTGSLRYDVLSRTATVFGQRICDNVIRGSCNIGELSSSNLLNNFDSLITSFPTDTEITYDSTFFELRFSLSSNANEDLIENNVRVEKQEFYNYYAYDDGTAEVAYGLGNLENEGMVAVKYNIKKSDTLTAIQLYLNPVENDFSQESVRLAVWVGSEEPDEMIWSSPDTNFYYTDQANYFYHYMLDTLLIVFEDIWVGWIQQPSTGLKFSAGFDKRTDNSSKVFYNLGTNWTQSSIPGSIMIRPSFGQAYNWVGVNDREPAVQLTVFPNPTTGQVFLDLPNGNFGGAVISVFDIAGRSVHEQTGYNGPVDLSRLNNGTYILRFRSEEGLFIQRLIIRK